MVGGGGCTALTTVDTRGYWSPETQTLCPCDEKRTVFKERAVSWGVPSTCVFFLRNQLSPFPSSISPSQAMPHSPDLADRGVQWCRLNLSPRGEPGSSRGSQGEERALRRAFWWWPRLACQGGHLPARAVWGRPQGYSSASACLQLPRGWRGEVEAEPTSSIHLETPRGEVLPQL